MGERKVVNKYYPPDFDRAKIARRRQPKNQQKTARMILPMSIRCPTCGNYIYKGTKFNSRKEEVEGETYLGKQILRFYFKCTKCCAEITFKTDWKNSDYTVESGATRNFEPWHCQDEEMHKEKQKKDAEEIGDSMKSLENRTLDSKRRIDIDAGVDELILLKATQARMSIDALLEANLQRQLDDQKMEELEDEVLVRSVVFRRSRNPIIKRTHEEEFFEEEDDLVFENKSLKS
ncbi:Coiled-coil domain-containing protein 94 [Capsicum annuum]|nr:Coiled-coil domain-containing protein 94 [Capsicum annuum]KAF3672140.1 Coiled-coil domain-containing protein 94 [Capsicum annuum]